jgi:hypothetical protein
VVGPVDGAYSPATGAADRPPVTSTLRLLNLVQLSLALLLLAPNARPFFKYLP